MIANSKLNNDLFLRRCAAFLVGLAVLAALYFGRELLIPIALAGLISFVLAPCVHWLERWRLPRVPAVLLVWGLSLALVAAGGWVVLDQAVAVGSDIGRYRTRLSQKFQSVREFLTTQAKPLTETFEAVQSELQIQEPASRAAEPADAPIDAVVPEAPPLSQSAPATQAASAPVAVRVVEPDTALISQAVGLVLPLFYPIVSAGVTLLFVLFFLIYQDDLRDRVIRLCGRAQVPVTTLALEDSARRMMRYIRAQVLANAMIGVFIGLGLFLFGIPNAGLWGLLAAVLRFIPLVGAFIAGLFPVAHSLVIFDSWWPAVLVLTWSVFVDMVSANILEPLLFGTQVGASPTALLIAFMLWTWLWGAVGLILATPITVCLVVLGRQIPMLEYLYIILSNEPALEPELRCYQRLLAGDVEETKSIVERHAKEHGVLRTCDEVLTPALAQLQQDWREGLITTERITSVRTHATAVLQGLRALEAPNADAAEPEQPTLEGQSIALALEAGEFDQLLPEIISISASIPPTRLRVLSESKLASEIAENVGAEPPLLLILAGIEPRTAGRFRHVLKRLQAARSAPPVCVAALGRAARPGGLLAIEPQARLRVVYTLSDVAREVSAALLRARAAGSGSSAELPAQPALTAV